ncbi:NPCBM/NEW2 domain-containing protein [Streptomyces glaucosporus]|uniref:NPCBM/NEW2 domain-containing protein n=1 Tax=Streptomyces glaucosporus TaxID=284044 RepID=UPI0031DD9F17
MHGGDTGAYEELHRRHAGAVLRYVRRCCRDGAAAGDLADEVFARTLPALPDGPDSGTAVRVHLLTAVRAVAAGWGRTGGWERLAEGFAVFAVSADSSGNDGCSEPDFQSNCQSDCQSDFEPDADARAMREAERSTVVRAFRGLPERWQTALWHTVVEGESPQDVAPLLGLTADAAAMLVYRAREGLRQAYLQAHVGRSRTASGDCARHAARLGTYARGALRARLDLGLRRHLELCADCRSAALGTKEVCDRLRRLLPVAVVGWGADVYSGTEGGVVEASAGTVAGVSADPFPDTASGTAPGAFAGVLTDAGARGRTAVPAARAGEPVDTGSAVGPVGLMGPVGPAGAGGAAASGSAVFDGLGATAKAGVTAGVMAAAVATALTLALIADGQRPRGPQPESRPPATSGPEASGASGTEAADAKAGSSKTLTVTPSESARGSAERGPAPEAGAGSGAGPVPVLPGSGSPSAPGAAPRAGQEPPPGTGPSFPGAVPPTGQPPAPTPPDSPAPSSSAVHRLDRLPRHAAGADRPTVRGGESDWMWKRSGLWIAGRDRGSGVTVRARSVLTVDLGGSCTALDALVGVDDLTAIPAAVRFSVYGDGVRLWQSDMVRRGDAPVPVHVSLTGRRTLRLVVEPRTALDAVALADWAQARITCG